MRYLIVLDCHSPVGEIYASGTNDGFVKGPGGLKHPVLDCTEIETHNPHYIFAKRPLKEPGLHQSLYLPHGSVVQIVVYDDQQARPPGFV
jgi:hypothetical protein